MKKITLLTLLMSVFALMGAQDWTEIPIPNAEFNDIIESGSLAHWVTTHETEPAVRESVTPSGIEEAVWCGVLGYTGSAESKRGDFLNFLDATIPTDSIEYKFSMYYYSSWMAEAKIDSFRMFTHLSAWQAGTDSTLRQIFAADTLWLSADDVKIWDSLEYTVTLDEAALDTLAGKQIVIEVGVAPTGMKGGESIPTAASWIHFYKPVLAFWDTEASFLQNVEASTAEVFVGHKVLNIQNLMTSRTTLRLYDLSGRIFKIQEIIGEDARISLSDLKTGIYMLTLSNEAGKQSYKIFVE